MARIGTWNVENFFRPDAGAPGGEDAYQAKLASLAETIKAMAPDVLAVQEVGDPEALADLATSVGGPWNLETAGPDGRGIRVGFLSRLPLSDVTQVSAFPAAMRAVQVNDTGPSLSEMGRPALAARVVLDTGRSLDLITCHLKSKLLTFPGGSFSPHDEDERARFAAYALYRRAAEAATVRAHATALLDGHGQDRALVVLGDLNDEPEAATTQILLGPPGSEIGTPGYGRPDRGDGQRLWNLAPRIPEANRYSRIYHGRPELIDHILASSAVTMHVADGDIDFAGPRPRSIGDDPNADGGAPASDHRPLHLAVDLPA